MISKTLDFAARLQQLRAGMVKRGMDAVIVPHADTFLGEYVPPSGERLKWLTGFSGSAGVAVVLADKAVVMSDGRYTIQLKHEVDPALYETADSTKIKVTDWIKSNGAPDCVIGYDPALHTPAEIEVWEKSALVLKPLEGNPVDEIWTDRPELPRTPVSIFPVSYAGRRHEEKIKQISAVLKEKGVTHFLISRPDSLAWLLNVRANDMAYIPVPLTYALVDDQAAVQWFIENSRIPTQAQATLGDHISFVTPDRMWATLEEIVRNGARVAIDLHHTPVLFSHVIARVGGKAIPMKDPCILPKACKTKEEQAAMRAAHVRDGIAMVRFLTTLDAEIREQKPLTEISVQEKLLQCRAQAPEYKGASFETICGFAENGAIVHYHSTEATNARLTPGNLLLLDSGAQYIDGTTDMTRTLVIGEPTAEMQERFTLVLKGHIAVANVKFPQGTTGAQIDALARAPLWAQGLDYAHGTGHGVGCHLAVHEEAASISPRGTDPVLPGMIISNEPGYYKEGAYGIRIESLVLAQVVGTCPDTGKPLLGFETITLCPIDRRLIVPEMLTAPERDWLNAYHARVRDTLSPSLNAAERDWLTAATAVI